MKLYLLKKIVQIVQEILIGQFRCLYWVWPDLRILIFELISIYRSLSQNGFFPFVSRQALHFSISNELNIAIIGKTIFHSERKPTAVYFVMKLFILL